MMRGAIIQGCIAVLAVLTAFFLPAFARAHHDDAPARDFEKLMEMNIDQLMEIEVITPTRTRIKLNQSPTTVYVITENQIRERGYRTLADALHDVPGFDFQHTYGIFPDLIHQRGLIGNNQRTLVYVDGILDNNISENAALGGTIRFPLYNVDHIEIVAGPTSALYGANAFNGVINIITKSGPDASSHVRTFGGTWKDDENMAGGFAFGINGGHSDAPLPFTYGIGGYFSKSDGPDFGGIQNLNEDGLGYWWSDDFNVADSETYNLTAKFTYGNLRFETINWQYLQGDGTFANGTYQIDTDANGFVDSAWDFRGNTFGLGYFWDIRPGLGIDSEVIVRHTELLNSSHEAYPNTPGPDAYNHPDDVRIASGYARPDDSYEIKERLHWQALDALENIFGLEAMYNVVPRGYGVYTQHKCNNYAGYWQGIYQAASNISLLGGYRLDKNSNYEDAHTYRLSSIVELGRFTVGALFSTGFRAPTAWELFNRTPQRLDNPDLDPEKMRAVELGFSYTIPGTGHVSLQGYHNEIKDLLMEVKTDIPNPDPNYDFWNQNRNIGKARITGIEFNADLNLTARCNVFFNYTFSRGEYSDLPDTLVESPAARDGERIPNIPEHKFNVGATYYLLPNLSFHLRSNYVYERDTIGTNPTSKVDDYILFHSNIHWRDAFIDGLFFELLINNLFDEAAYDPGIRTATGSYYPTRHPIEGRNIWLTAGYRF
jgi:iron complex outermembrane receptor protein